MSNEPVAWMVYTQDGQSCYVTDNQADISPTQRALPLYTDPVPTDEALLRQALEALDVYREYDPEGGGVADKVAAALRERLGLRYEPTPNEGSEP